MTGMDTGLALLHQQIAPAEHEGPLIPSNPFPSIYKPNMSRVRTHVICLYANLEPRLQTSSNYVVIIFLYIPTF